MTSRVRRRLFICSLAVAFTLPAESIFLKAVATPDAQQATQQWVASLSPDQLSSYGTVIQTLPFAYRRAVMTALPADQRAQIWRSHIGNYITGHPELDSTAVALLNTASSLATAANLSNPTDSSRAQIDAVGNQIKALLGRDTAEYLLYRLGPNDGTFASAVPVSERLANFVRSHFVAFADPDEDCFCNLDWGCVGMFSYCGDGNGCRVITKWPACGWLWDDPCNGVCKAGGLGGS
jgi:hypothetical protein